MHTWTYIYAYIHIHTCIHLYYIFSSVCQPAEYDLNVPSHRSSFGFAMERSVRIQRSVPNWPKANSNKQYSIVTILVSLLFQCIL